MRFIAPLSIALLGAATVLAGKPIQNVQVTLRGKKYDISDVTTVGDLEERVQKAAGSTSSSNSKHSVLFDGKRLSASDVLSEVGVQEGSKLNMVPASSSSKTKKASPPAAAAAASATTTSSTDDGAAKDLMQDYLKNAGADTGKLDELMKEVGGADGKMPSLEESMKQMSSMMNSPMFQEYMSNPERLEESRQMILNNPMLKGMMGGMPGMEELLNDPEKWREAMTAAGNLYKNMDPEDLMKAMSGAGLPPGLGGGAPGMNGLFEGTLENSAAAAALEELDEED